MAIEEPTTAALVTSLARARRYAGEYAAVVAEVDRQIEESELGQKRALFCTRAKAAQASANTYAAKIRRLDAPNHPALSVVASTSVDYDKGAAVEWCERNAPNLVTTALDKRRFTAVVKAMGKAGVMLDFVTIETVPAVRIKRDLSEWDVTDAQESTE